MSVRIRSEGSGCGGIAGRLFITVFFFIFFAVGMLFTVFVVGEVIRTVATYGWDEIPCEILLSQVKEASSDEDPYIPTVRYQFEIDGATYESDRIWREAKGFSDYGEAQEIVSEYPPGAPATCLVDPDQPRLAILKRNSLLLVLVVFFPLIFVGVGGGGLYFVWKKDRGSSQKTGLESISRKARGGGKQVGIILGAIFTLVGIGIFFGLFLPVILDFVDAQSWQETPCTVISSSVRSHDSDDGTTYSIDILFEYQYQDHTYRSNRHSFSNWSSSGYSSKKRVIDEFPHGAQTWCWVNPDRPSQAVIDRDFQWGYLIALFPLVFTIVGLAVLVHSLRAVRSEPNKSPEERTSSLYHTPSGPIVLKPQQSPAMKLFGMAIFSLIWNGIVSVFVWNLVSEWMSGHHQWGLALFLVPFVLVGIGTLVGMVYFALGFFNPRPRLTLSNPTPRLGERVHVEWKMSGRSGRIEKLSITFEGRESATYRRGTDTTTDHETFATHTIIETLNEYEIAQGSREIEIPEDTMHSFKADNNSISWHLKVAGDIPRWPDVDADFEVEVRPLRARGSGGIR
ncbi:MAG: DUF3592 domain-containing protein [bacterium]|nr:DUF3592 domain-containing protein [bacterium]